MTDIEQHSGAGAVATSSRPRGFLAVWGLTLLGLVVALGIVVTLFFGTAHSIIAIWNRSETFAHGYLIIPISVWLVWEKRRGLRMLQPMPTLWPALLFVPLGFAWLLGSLVDTLVVQQFAFVGMLVTTIWMMLGNRVARFLAFPILFLFLGVPVGEGLIYPMMNFTADFTVKMLEITGIPVYREGTFFTIPSGQWSVVEACSGVRYLIASVTLGVLFAYLTYNTWWKRGLFVLFSIFVPVIANGLRAYMIVMLGHLSGMKLAVGVDHLIYGWVFFGIVVTIMFAIGSIWREPPAPDPVPQDAGVAPAGHRDVVRALAALTLAAAVWPAMGWALSDHGSAVEAVPVAAPVPAPGWSLLDGTSAWDWRPRVVGADGSVYAFYASTQAQGPAPPVGLYLGVYRTQRQGAELVSSANVMIVQKHPVWSDTRMTPVSVRVGDRQLHLLRHEMLSRRGERLLVWSWYAVASHHTANPYVAKLLEAKSRLLGNRGEGALIAIATPYVDDEQAAADRLTRFLDAMLPGIDKEMGRALSASAADD